MPTIIYNAELKEFNVPEDQTDLGVIGSYQYFGNKFNIELIVPIVGTVFSGQENLVDFLPIITIRANQNYKDWKEIEAFLLESDFMTKIGERVYLY